VLPCNVNCVTELDRGSTRLEEIEAEIPKPMKENFKTSMISVKEKSGPEGIDNNCWS
jgi:hypothetical protein